MLRLAFKASAVPTRAAQSVFAMQRRYLLSSPRPTWDASNGCGSLFSLKAYSYMNKHIENRTSAANAHIQDTHYENAAVLDILRHTEQDVELSAIHNNVGELVNTDFSYKSVKPGGSPLTEKMFQEIMKLTSVRSISALKKEFFDHALSHYGGGFVWLMQDTDPRNWEPGLNHISQTDVFVFNTFYGDCPLIFPGAKPLLCVNVWEHAYWTDFGPDREKYLEAFWENIDWEFVLNNIRAPFEIDVDQTGPHLDQAHHIELYEETRRPLSLSQYIPPAVSDRAVLDVNLESQAFFQFHGIEGKAYQPTLGQESKQTASAGDRIALGSDRLPEEGESLEDVLSESQRSIEDTATLQVQRMVEDKKNGVKVDPQDYLPPAPDMDEITNADHRELHKLFDDPNNPAHILPKDQVMYFRRKWMSADTTPDDHDDANDVTYEQAMAEFENGPDADKSPMEMEQLREVIEKDVYPSIGAWIHRETTPPPEIDIKKPPTEQYPPIDAEFFELPSVQAELRACRKLLSSLNIEDDRGLGDQKSHPAGHLGEFTIPPPRYPTLHEMLVNPAAVPRMFDPAYRRTDDAFAVTDIQDLNTDKALLEIMHRDQPIQYKDITQVYRLMELVRDASASGELEALERDMSTRLQQLRAGAMEE
eukprot:TRINITY_DN6595_c0_g1_i1.p1 TRINITY_DN6595_c0_g1~~TRINITY_DN6595_c0_g1_i1.p1  ORF type:complete len:647 (+),score=145.67 TRINITY_DN6595_c0_g1_i1:53-1993(+)